MLSKIYTVTVNYRCFFLYISVINEYDLKEKNTFFTCASLKYFDALSPPIFYLNSSNLRICTGLSYASCPATCHMDPIIGEIDRG